MTLCGEIQLLKYLVFSHGQDYCCFLLTATPDPVGEGELGSILSEEMVQCIPSLSQLCANSLLHRHS